MAARARGTRGARGARSRGVTSQGQDYAQELTAAAELARAAGALLLQVYATDFQVVEKADDQGPVTEADRRANAFLTEGLRRRFPGDGVVAEETRDTSDAQRFARCWFVDPMDGTREFVGRNGEFAVHVGLAVEGEARVGVVYRPVGDVLYAGVVGRGGWREVGGVRTPLQLASVPQAAPLRLLVSRSHRSRRVDAVRKQLGIRQDAVTALGSVGLKCGRIAEGGAELYVHTGDKSYRWDACAPEAVLRAAGGTLTDLEGKPYRYDGAELRNMRGLLGCAPGVLERALKAVDVALR